MSDTPNPNTLNSNDRAFYDDGYRAGMRDGLSCHIPQVKPLEWVVERDGKHVSGGWVITKHGPENFHVSLSADLGDEASLAFRKYLDGAKHYVQTIHERRILSALER